MEYRQRLIGGGFVEALKIDKVTYWYPESMKPAIENVSLSVKQGEMVLLSGPSGCGKSTLLRLMNKLVPDYYGGRIKGSTYLWNKDIRDCSRKDIASRVGMVYQHPEKQIVLQDVERELAFGLENLNTDMKKMKRNVSEVISFLNLESIRERSTMNISGGEKQKLAIGSVIAMDPDIIIFDEPVSQLDPIAAEEVLNCISRLNRDMGKTIIIAEQRLDKCFEMADRIIFMEDGKIIGEGAGDSIPENVNKRCFLPAIPYMFRKAGCKHIPLNVKGARYQIEESDFSDISCIQDHQSTGCPILQVSGLGFEYDKKSSLLKDISLTLNKGEFLTIMGENGAGKSTLFKIISGLMDNYRGQVKIHGKSIKDMGTKERVKTIGYLSQNPNDYLGRDTVFDEVAYTLRNIGEFDAERVNYMLEGMNLLELKHKNPRDLSGGEKQRTALACTIIANPEILVLDEPTRGMDWDSKERLGKYLKKLCSSGTAVVLITHDVDFAADYTDNIALMFDGSIIASGECREMIKDAIYYSPQAAKVFRGFCSVVRTSEAIECLKVLK